MVQISVPRGGSNAVARMVGQSPDIAAVLRSPLLESGPEGLRSAAGEVVRREPGKLLYIKEHAVFLSGGRFDWFGPSDRFLVVVRDPAYQLASAVVAVAGNPRLLRRRLSRRHRRPVTGPQISSLLDDYASRLLPGLPGAGRVSEPVSPVGGTPPAPWRRLVSYVRDRHDFRPLASVFADLYGDQPRREECRSDVEWFDQAVFEVVARSWAAAVRLAQRLDELGAGRIAVVDFTVLQTRPELVAEVCDRLRIRSDPRMVAGPWRPSGQWFDAGLDRVDGHRWVERARASTVLEPARALPYDPLSLPEPARSALLPGVAAYLTLLSHPAFVGPRTTAGIAELLHDSGNGFLAGSPVGAWCLAGARTGVHSDLTRSVEQAHPHLAACFELLRQTAATATDRWPQPAYTTPC